METAISKKDFFSMREAYDELVKDLIPSTIQFIVGALKQVPTRRITLSDSNVYEDYCEYNGMLYIAYDGGNHPEYAANLYSEVTDIELTNDESFVVKTIDGEMQSDCIAIADLLSIADYLEYAFSLDDIDEEV